jgi:hypothetical protein
MARSILLPVCTRSRKIRLIEQFNPTWQDLFIKACKSILLSGSPPAVSPRETRRRGWRRQKTNGANPWDTRQRHASAGRRADEEDPVTRSALTGKPELTGPPSGTALRYAKFLRKLRNYCFRPPPFCSAKRDAGDCASLRKVQTDAISEIFFGGPASLTATPRSSLRYDGPSVCRFEKAYLECRHISLT